MAKEYITLAKKEELEKELTELINVKRKEVAAALEYAKSLGDLSENAEYSQAREDQAYLEDRIAQVEYILKNAEITEKHNTGMVEVGSTVSISLKGKNVTYLIVGSEEVDLANGKISNESPLGKAMIGKLANQKGSYSTPKGEEIEFTVKSVS